MNEFQYHGYTIRQQGLNRDVSLDGKRFSPAVRGAVSVSQASKQLDDFIANNPSGKPEKAPQSW